MVDTKAGEGPADLREVIAIDWPAGLGHVKGPAGAIGVERAGQAEGPEHVRERVHDGLQRLAEPELGIEQALGGIIEDGDEGLALGRTVGQPGVRATVEMQQFAEAGSRLAPPPVAAPRPSA